MVEVLLRPAQTSEASTIGGFILAAGQGLFEFMFEGLVLDASAADVLVHLIREEDGLFSYRRCLFAEVEGTPLGLLSRYPADLFHEQTFDTLPPDRSLHLAAFPKTQDWGSYYISAVAVTPTARRQGIGRQIMLWALADARQQGFSRVSLHVWADNAPARALYQDLGFTVFASLDIAWHPRLPHSGGMLLLSRPVDVGAGRSES
jgi:ribosomal protein S18 acetylase RimI-like enzyme